MNKHFYRTPFGFGFKAGDFNFVLTWRNWRGGRGNLSVAATGPGRGFAWSGQTGAIHWKF